MEINSFLACIHRLANSLTLRILFTFLMSSTCHFIRLQDQILLTLKIIFTNDSIETKYRYILVLNPYDKWSDNQFFQILKSFAFLLKIHIVWNSTNARFFAGNRRSKGDIWTKERGYHCYEKWKGQKGVTLSINFPQKALKFSCGIKSRKLCV